MDWFEGKPVGIEIPPSVDLKVVETAPGIKGATASAQKKPATLETGLVVQVPSFINEGEVIRSAPRTAIIWAGRLVGPPSGAILLSAKLGRRKLPDKDCPPPVAGTARRQRVSAPATRLHAACTNSRSVGLDPAEGVVVHRDRDCGVHEPAAFAASVIPS